MQLLKASLGQSLALLAAVLILLDAEMMMMLMMMRCGILLKLLKPVYGPSREDEMLAIIAKMPSGQGEERWINRKKRRSPAWQALHGNDEWMMMMMLEVRTTTHKWLLAGRCIYIVMVYHGRK